MKETQNDTAGTASTAGDRVAIITGGSRGLGAALATDLVRDGWTVVVDGRDAATLAATAARIRNDAATSGNLIEVAGDVADASHRAALVQTARAAGSLELVVNNASVLGPSPLHHLGEHPLDAFGQIFDVNVVAPLGLIQLALPDLRANRGTVIDVSSDAAVEGYEGWGGYGSSKAALDQISKVLAAEESDVHVYAFDPGDMRTEMHQQAFPGEDISDRPAPETVIPAVRALLATSPPSGRYRAADLLADTVKVES
jgi:NAD(P)-dependent dehydrogenase (short-subunit alcohol dehydrogenase family)